MRVVGLDIHRVFAEAVMLDDGRVVRLGRVGMTREHLEAFARRLAHDDHVVIDGRRCRPSGNATAVAEVIGPHVGRVVIANHRAQERSIHPRSGRHQQMPAGPSAADRRGAHQDRCDRRDRAGAALRQRLPARGLDPGRGDAWLTAAGHETDLRSCGSGRG
jgi:hypothetical protein